MIRHIRTVSLLLLSFSLLASAATAYAECAWVVWAYTLEKSTGEQYSIELARPTRQECLTAVRGFAVVLKDQGYTVTGGEPSSTEVLARQGGTRVKYFCLPDTMDPRGPKAGGR